MEKVQKCGLCNGIDDNDNQFWLNDGVDDTLMTMMMGIKILIIIKEFMVSYLLRKIYCGRMEVFRVFITLQYEHQELRYLKNNTEQ